MKRLLFVDHTPFAGGAQLVLAQHIAHLDKTAFEPHVACSNAVPMLVERYQAAGANVHIVDFPRLRGDGLGMPVATIRLVSRLRQIVIKQQIDVIISNTERAAYFSSVVSVLTKKPLLWWVRDFAYSKVLFALLHRIPRRIICVSQAIKDFYLSPTDKRGVVVYVASDLYDRLRLVGADQIVSERKKWGFEPTDMVVGFMGRLVAEKGAGDVIEAVAKLTVDYPQLRLLIVGSGKDQVGDVEQDLHQLVKVRGLEKVIVFAGYQNNEPLYYQLFDIFVMATRDREAFATTVVQAMMAEKAVVATDVGGTKELVFDGETGLLIPPHDVEALAAAIKKLLDDASLGQRLAKTGQARVLQYHQESYATAALECLYTEI